MARAWGTREPNSEASTCIYCKRTFYSRDLKRKYCSEDCRVKEEAVRAKAKAQIKRNRERGQIKKPRSMDEVSRSREYWGAAETPLYDYGAQKLPFSFSDDYYRFFSDLYFKDEYKEAVDWIQRQQIVWAKHVCSSPHIPLFKIELMRLELAIDNVSEVKKEEMKAKITKRMINALRGERDGNSDWG